MLIPGLRPQMRLIRQLLALLPGLFSALTSLGAHSETAIESKDAMKGSVDIGGLAQGTFTAKRQ